MDRPLPTTSLLLVDDRPENLRALEDVLAPLGQRLVKAGSGTEALRMVLAMDFAAILLDVCMPVMDGYQTAETIRSREKSRKTPILFLTAHPVNEVQLFKGYASGAVDYMPKPVAAEILRSKVQVFVEMAQHAQVAEAMSRELEDLNAGLKEANQDLEAFSYSLSHDLRGPLRQVKGFANILRKGLSSVDDGEVQENLVCLEKAVGRMEELVKGMLAIGCLSRREMTKATVDLHKLVRSLVKELGQETESRSVRWEIMPLPRVPGDASLLRAAFRNLLENALKFTRRKAEAVIRVDSEDQGREWVVTVRDNGEGFDPAFAGRLFGMFQRLHGDEAFEGTGIGLASVRRIVNRHRGRVWAESHPGEGAAFHIVLPKENRHEPSRPFPAAPSFPLS